MRDVAVTILILLTQLGLLGRLTAQGECCPETMVGHLQVVAHTHGDHGPDHSHDDCGEDHEPMNQEDCPFDCGDHHHHHHGNCIHSLQLSVVGDGTCRLAPPHAIALGHDCQHSRAPDGPVMELDKPPLI